MTAASGKRSPPEHAARYETLRAFAVERHLPASRDGLVVLLRQGVAAWMDAWSRLLTPASRLERPVNQERPTLPADASAEVVRVLVAMTLENIQEVLA